MDVGSASHQQISLLFTCQDQFLNFLIFDSGTAEVAFCDRGASRDWLNSGDACYKFVHLSGEGENHKMKQRGLGRKAMQRIHLGWKWMPGYLHRQQELVRQ